MTAMKSKVLRPKLAASRRPDRGPYGAYPARFPTSVPDPKLPVESHYVCGPCRSIFC